MGKNGKMFFSLVSGSEYRYAIWNPYDYRHNDNHSLAEYASIQKLSRKESNLTIAPFRPIEYRDIPAGNYLSFNLELIEEISQNLPVVREGTLLFGTMRAYLGNIVLTPEAAWVRQNSPLTFHVKSEFLEVCPFDKLHLFWLVYLRSPQFLENLPAGGGGTRPRLDAEALAQTPVAVPSEDVRREINEMLQQVVQTEWYNRIVIASMTQKMREGHGEER